MEISIFGMKFRVEILILIVLAFWILCGHVLCSCSKVTLTEGFHIFEKMTSKVKKEGFTPAIMEQILSKMKEMKEMKEMKKEGFTNSSRFSLTNNDAVNTSSWFTPDLTNPNSKGSQAIANRKKQPIPLPEGEMLLFANTPFKPECCPNAYSNSMGCACMTSDGPNSQYNYLIQRGGNNVPYSEY